MKAAEFNDICHREHQQDRGVIVSLYLTEDSYAELLADVFTEPVQVTGEPPPAGRCGARLDAMTNPATHTAVSIRRGLPKALFTDTAEVTRWVPAVQPIPPDPAVSGEQGGDRGD